LTLDDHFMKARLIFVSALAVALTACGPQTPSDNSAATPAAPDATAPATPAVASLGLISVDPAKLDECFGVVATVKWDVATSNPGVAAVQVFVGPEADQRLFTEGGNVGQAETGLWTAPGATFRLKDKATGTELDRITVAGPACQ